MTETASAVRRFVQLLQVGVFLVSCSASAENFPERPVKIIVPSAPGGSIDATARIVGQKLSEIWGKPVVIDNRAGGSMKIGAEAVARATPDGYTLLVAHDGTMPINQVVYPELRYNATKSFEPIAILSSNPYVILVNAELPVKTVADLVAYARKEPDKLNHASGGTSTLLAAELLKALGKVNITSVMYRGGGPAVAAVMAGESQFCIVDLGTGSAGMQSSRARAIATTGMSRSPKFPDIPTVHESGVPGYENTTWMGMFAPAGTPRATLEAIEKAVKTALQDPGVKSRLGKIGMDARSGSASEMRSVLAADIAKWNRLVTENNIKLSE
jgi:tripartite-type tricarboxylate transporter receptor subunit TctC